MREIKFRVWEPDDKTMLAIDFKNDEEMSFDWTALSGALPVMQYTGLKDKNGVEIYEGDIVEHRNYIKELLGKYEVRWGQFGFTLWDSSQPEVLSHYISPEQLEVIGNIYENKEPLK